MRTRNFVIDQEQKEIEKAFEVIKEITKGQFCHDGEYMLKQFEIVKPVLFYTRNNKWLIMEYLAEHKEYKNEDNPYSLGEVVSSLLGIQGQMAVDTNDVELENKTHIECCIWQSINLNAKYNIKAS